MPLKSSIRRLWAPLLIVALLLLFGAVNTVAQEGQATLVIINFVGSEMVLTLDGQVYRVPGVDTAPEGGRLTLNLAPGRHNYSGQIPGGPGENGSVELAAGQTVVLGARLDRSGPVLGADDIVLEEPQDVLVFFEASLTPPPPTPQPEPVPLQPLPAGQGALVLVNYIGEDLNVDIGGTLYTVPANQRRQINLSPGRVSYSANAGRSGLNGTAVVTAGAYTGLGFTREATPQEPNYEVGEPAPTPVPLTMSVFPVPVGDGSGTGTSEGGAPAPAEAPPSPPAVTRPPANGNLNVINYIGETVTFTINNQAYAVAANSELALNLAPGEYTFTASIPKTAANGSLRLQADHTTRLSLSLNSGGEQMMLYIE